MQSVYFDLVLALFTVFIWITLWHCLAAFVEKNWQLWQFLLETAREQATASALIVPAPESEDSDCWLKILAFQSKVYLRFTSFSYTSLVFYQLKSVTVLSYSDNSIRLFILDYNLDSIESAFINCTIAQLNFSKCATLYLPVYWNWGFLPHEVLNCCTLSG